MNSLLSILIPKTMDISPASEQISRTGKKGKVILTDAEKIGLRLICINVAKSAFMHYLERNFLQFDALVGENCCQIRACMLQEMLLNQSVDEEQLVHVIAKMDRIAQRLIETQSADSEDEMDKLTEDQESLVLCHLLTCTRDPENKLMTNESMLSRFSDIPINLPTLVEMTFQAKKCLADRSVKYIRKLALSEPSVYKKVLKQEECANGSGVSSTALFYNFKIILKKIKENRRLLLINIVGKKLLAFRTNQEGVFEQFHMDPIQNQPALVIRYEIYQKDEAKKLIEILKTGKAGLEEMLLADAADHSPFSGLSKEKNIAIFEQESVSLILNAFVYEGFQNIDITNITKFLGSMVGFKKISVKDIRKARSACHPAPLEEIIALYFERKTLKMMGCQMKKAMKIVHVYLNSIGNEINDSVASSSFKLPLKDENDRS